MIFCVPLQSQTKRTGLNAEVAQLVEHNLAKVGVASSSLVFRSKKGHLRMTLNFEKELRLVNIHPTGFHYMSVVRVHKAGFFVFIPPQSDSTEKAHNGKFGGADNSG